MSSNAINVGYLAQLWNIVPVYAKTIYDMLPESAKTGDEGFEFVEVHREQRARELLAKRQNLGRPKQRKGW